MTRNFQEATTLEEARTLVETALTRFGLPQLAWEPDTDSQGDWEFACITLADGKLRVGASTLGVSLRR
jgi:hypothetical protein